MLQEYQDIHSKHEYNCQLADSTLGRSTSDKVNGLAAKFRSHTLGFQQAHPRVIEEWEVGVLQGVSPTSMKVIEEAFDKVL